MFRLIKSLLADTLRYSNIYGYLYWNFKGVRISSDSSVSTKARIASTCHFYAGCLVTYRAQIDHFTYGTRCMIDNAIIGKFCSIAPGAIVGGLNHPVENISTHPLTYRNEEYDNSTKPAVIGNDVWIGANTVILSNINIPDGCVVAAGAVVTRSFEPFTIIGGVPARVIGLRHANRSFVDAVSKTEDVNLLRQLAEKIRNGKKL